ncbi:MAG: hypothetical protein KY475_00410 [Planctomycetes bacterium]|nr:hypothetical protein [Planctomycetota bacterium]
MRQLFPTFIILPVQAIDTPQIRPRGRLQSSARGLVERGETAAHTSGDCGLWLTWNLFTPPAHILHLDTCRQVQQEHPHWSLKRIAAQVGIGHMTVRRALAYGRRMEEFGLQDPYRELHEAPTQASRWKPRRKSTEG